MNEITIANEDRSKQAYVLHNQIMVNGTLATQYLLTMCKDLKTMRDEKLYIELGYNDFGEYCDKAVGIGSRQGYTYIQSFEKLGAKLIEENAHLGITKLSLLAQLNPVDRIQALESGELENMSTREVKELVEKSNAQSEQLSLITEERDDLKEEKDKLISSNIEQDNLIRKLKAEIKDLKNKPTEISSEPSDEKLAEIRAELQAEFDEKYDTNMKAAVKQAKAEEKEKTAKQISKAKEEAKKEAEANKAKEIAEAVKKAKEDAKAESKELEETISNLKAETVELEKRLKASDGDTQKFLIYMQSFQDYLNKALSIVNGLEKEQKEKMQNAVTDVLKQILNQIGG